MSKIWENAAGCAEEYRCASSLYLISVMSQCYSIIMYPGISAHGHSKEVLYVLNSFYKRYIYPLISNVQLTGSKIFDSHMKIHTDNQNNDVSLAKEFQQHLTK